MAAGDGSLRFQDELQAGGISVGPAGAHAVRGLHICRLAADVPAVPPEAVLPNYLREPDAKPQR
jgi:tRNA threonylcarbamoyladenosine biosynthesis protein TsaB